MVKIAFCFLSYGDIEQQAVWQAFLKDAPADLYSIYIHRSDGVKKSSLPNSTVIKTIHTRWGTYSLVNAELNLYQEAIKDKDVVFCIFLSGDTIPITSFENVYKYITKCNNSKIVYMYGNDNPETRRRTAAIATAFLPNKDKYTLVKAFQWKILVRDNIELLLQNRQTLDKAFSKMPIADEHAIIILMTELNVKNFISTKFMHIDWAHTNDVVCTKSHPRAKPYIYHKDNLTKAFIEKIRSQGSIFLRKTCSVEQLDPAIILGI